MYKLKSESRFEPDFGVSSVDKVEEGDDTGDGKVDKSEVEMALVDFVSLGRLFDRFFQF